MLLWGTGEPEPLEVLGSLGAHLHGKRHQVSAGRDGGSEAWSHPARHPLLHSTAGTAATANRLPATGATLKIHILPYEILQTKFL